MSATIRGDPNIANLQEMFPLHSHHTIESVLQAQNGSLHAAITVLLTTPPDYKDPLPRQRGLSQHQSSPTTDLRPKLRRSSSTIEVGSRKQSAWERLQAKLGRGHSYALI
jgi:hypothetical protein